VVCIDILPLLKSGTVFAECQKWHFSISISEEMVGSFDFRFVNRLLLGVRPPKNIKRDFKIFSVVPNYLWDYHYRY